MINDCTCPARRTFLSTAAAGAAFIGLPTLGRAQGKLRVGALLAGRVDDRGFMEAGWRGLERARLDLGVSTSHIDQVDPRKDLLAAALTRLAESGTDLVIAHGGQNNEAAVEVSQQFPKVQFVVTQGGVVGPNLTSYDVLQEESAYLAGVLAARMTRTGIVGHMSGIRVRPGLKGRAGYAAGVRATNSQVKLLTNFSGNQDDNPLSRRIALAQIDAGADIIFTMLNAGRDGVSQACRDRNKRQIGNVIDWVNVDPAIFIGSAIADVGIGVYNAIRDMKNGRFSTGIVKRVGLAEAAAVRLSVANDVPSDVKALLADVAADIVAGRTIVPEQYEGAEFGV